jgi:hypothetical protein
MPPRLDVRNRTLQGCFVPTNNFDTAAFLATPRSGRSVRSGREAVIALRGADEFFGEGCLSVQARRTAMASAMLTTEVIAAGARPVL